MADQQLTKDNHYVPRLYLKNFVSPSGKLYAYRVLVADQRVPLWKECSVKGLAYHEHLYTRVVHGEATDEIDQWFDLEFENPAAEVLRKVINEGRLTKTDWQVLARFVASQDVRTPARLSENLRRWQTAVPEVLSGILQEIPEKLRRIARGEEDPLVADASDSSQADYFPLRVRQRLLPEQEEVEVSVEVAPGRALWIFSMRHLLSHAVNVLLGHRWTILHAPENLPWFTSDDPVVKLNWYGKGEYDFNGGWGSEGTEIMLPISPKHLLYAQVGRRPPTRGSIVSREHATAMRRAFAQHAFRAVISSSCDDRVLDYRPRSANAEAFRREVDHWKDWHDQQNASERSLVEDQPNDKT